MVSSTKNDAMYPRWKWQKLVKSGLWSLEERLCFVDIPVLWRSAVEGG